MININFGEKNCCNNVHFFRIPSGTENNQFYGCIDHIRYKCKKFLLAIISIVNFAGLTKELRPLGVSGGLPQPVKSQGPQAVLQKCEAKWDVSTIKASWINIVETSSKKAQSRNVSQEGIILSFSYLSRAELS